MNVSMKSSSKVAFSTRDGRKGSTLSSPPTRLKMRMPQTRAERLPGYGTDLKWLHSPSAVSEPVAVRFINVAELLQKRIGPQWSFIRLLMLGPEVTDEVDSDMESRLADKDKWEFPTTSMLCEFVSGLSTILYDPYIDPNSELYGKKRHKNDSGARFRSLLHSYWFRFDNAIQEPHKMILMNLIQAGICVSNQSQSRTAIIYRAVRNK